jgi:hypothetical protein
LRSTVCVIGLVTGGLSHAGNLDRCDLARIEARNTVLDTYSRVLYELQNKALQVRTDEADMSALVAELNSRESADLGDTDRRVAGACDDSVDELNGTVQAAGVLARHDISAVLAKRLINIDLSRLLP